MLPQTCVHPLSHRRRHDFLLPWSSACLPPTKPPPGWVVLACAGPYQHVHPRSSVCDGDALNPCRDISRGTSASRTSRPPCWRRSSCPWCLLESLAQRLCGRWKALAVLRFEFLRRSKDLDESPSLFCGHGALEPLKGKECLDLSVLGKGRALNTAFLLCYSVSRGELNLKTHLVL